MRLLSHLGVVALATWIVLTLAGFLAWISSGGRLGSLRISWVVVPLAVAAVSYASRRSLARRASSKDTSLPDMRELVPVVLILLSTASMLVCLYLARGPVSDAVQIHRQIETMRAMHAIQQLVMAYTEETGHVPLAAGESSAGDAHGEGMTPQPVRNLMDRIGPALVRSRLARQAARQRGSGGTDRSTVIPPLPATTDAWEREILYRVLEPKPVKTGSPLGWPPFELRSLGRDGVADAPRPPGRPASAGFDSDIVISYGMFTQFLEMDAGIGGYRFWAVFAEGAQHRYPVLRGGGRYRAHWIRDADEPNLNGGAIRHPSKRLRGDSGDNEL